jgi:hypothetical protein
MSSDTSSDTQSDGYGGLFALARSLSVTDTRLDVPPHDLWAGIEALVAAGPRLATTSAGMSEARFSPTPFDAARARRMRRTRVPYLLGAAAAFVAAVIGLLAFVDRDGASRVTTLDAISLRNDGLAPEGASSKAKATLVAQADGRYALEVDVTGLPDTGDGFLELWIIDTKVEGMYSLGPLHGSGRYALPDHVEPASFPIVDVSIEPADGAPQHSGKSILRGTLTI